MHLRGPMGERATQLVSVINANGGLLGRRLLVAVEDDGCDARRAQRIAHDIAARRPVAIIGHPCATAAIAASAIYREAGLLLIATGVRHPALTPPRKPDHIFRLAGRDDRQGASIAATVAQRHAGRRIAIVRDHSQAGRQLATAIERELAIAGQLRPVVVAYTAGDKDHGAATSKLLASSAEVLVFTGQATEAAIIRSEVRALGRQVHAIGTDALAADHRQLAPIAGEPTFVVMLPWPGDVRGTDAALLAKAALEVWIAAARDSGSTQADRVGEALRARSHATSLGSIRFDGQGDAVVPSHVPVTWTADGWSAEVTPSAK